MSIPNEQLIAILQGTINDLALLGSGTDFYFEDSIARAIATYSHPLTHKAKFFVADRRITPLTSLLNKLQSDARTIDTDEF